MAIQEKIEGDSYLSWFAMSFGFQSRRLCKMIPSKNAKKVRKLRTK
jgi:hypothetical protein